MEPKSPFERAGVWFALGGVLAALAALGMWLGATQRGNSTDSLFHYGWFVAGFVMAAIAFLAAVFGAILMAGHRYAEHLVPRLTRESEMPSRTKEVESVKRASNMDGPPSTWNPIDELGRQKAILGRITIPDEAVRFNFRHASKLRPATDFEHGLKTCNAPNATGGLKG